MIRILLLAFVYFVQRNCATNVIAYEVEDNQTFIEADYIEKGDDKFFANGHVILRRTSSLLNADVIEGIKNVKEEKQNYSKTNIKTSNIKNYNENSKENKKETYKFYIKNWVKARTDDDNILFAKSMFHDEGSEISLIDNAQIYPGQGHDHKEIYATKIIKRNNFFKLSNVSICPCKLFTDSNVDSNRSKPFQRIEEEDELLEKPIEKNSIDNTDSDMHKKIRNTFMSIKADEVIFDKDENLMTLKKMYIKLFGLPIFYLPSYSFHSDGSGDSGILFPQIIPIGKRQLGFEIPLYLKISNNMDLLISRTQYIDIIPMKMKDGRHGDAYKLKDLERYRESSTQFRFRHLLSNNNSYENFYQIEGMMTDRTQLVDADTSLGKVDKNGDKLMGYRWMLDFRSRMKLTKTTFFKADVNLISDKNFAYYYRFDHRQIQENKIHLYDVDENRYLSAEILSYQSRLMSLDKKTNPIAFPVLRGEYDFKKDKLGGNFYLKSKAYYINREEGFTSGAAGIDVGYRLPYHTKLGTKITFDTMARSLSNYFNYNQYNPDDQQDSIYGNYSDIINKSYYVSQKYLNDSANAHFQQNFFGFSKLQIEHPMVMQSIFGKTVVNPKFAFRTAQNNANSHAPVEDNIAMQMNYYNVFDLVQSGGFGLYDKGQSLVYGLDFKHKVKKDIEVFGGVAQNMRLNSGLEEDVLPEYAGFRRVMSDVFAHFGAKLNNFSANGYINYDQYNKQPRMLGAALNYGNRFTSLSLQYNSLSKNATMFDYPTELLTLDFKMTPTTKIKLIGRVMYNLKSIKTETIERSGGFTMYNIGAYYTVGCISVGIMVMKTNFVIKNTPSDTVIRVKFSFAGF